MPRMATIRLAVVFAVLIALGSSGCEDKLPTGRPSQAGAPAGSSPSSQTPTDDQCRRFAESLVKAVRSGDVAAIDRHIDWDAVLERTTAGIDAAADFRRAFIAGVKKSVVGGGGFSDQVAARVKDGGSYRLLRIHDQEGRKRALFRMLMADGNGVNYHDFILVRRSDDKVQAADVFVFLSAECLSQTMRRAYVSVAAESSKSLLAKLTQQESDYAKHASKLGEMSAHLRGGRGQQALDIYDQLPDSLKKDKSVLLIRLQAASTLDEQRYEQAIQDFRRFHRRDACLDFVTLDSHFMQKKFDKARAAIGRIEESLGGDPYLDVLRGNSYLEEQKYEQALEYARKAAEAEKDLTEAYWILVTVSLAQKDFGETTRLLSVLERDLQVPIGDLTTVPLYAEYVKSPQYAEFAKRQGQSSKAAGAASRR